MMLTRAIELVVEDTRENTDPNLTINEVISLVKELTVEDIHVAVSAGLRIAYFEVMRADQSRIDYCLGLI